MTTITRNDGTTVTVTAKTQAAEYYAAVDILNSWVDKKTDNCTPSLTQAMGYSEIPKTVNGILKAKRIGRPPGSKNRKARN